jgi:hypothetical protein
MNLLVGPDVDRSVLMMRFANVGVVALLFFMALFVGGAAGRRALLLTWAVVLVPVGIFFIASTNPSSWVITGVGLYWYFLYTALTIRPHRSRAALLSWGGVLATAVLALGSRSDSVYPLALSTIAVLMVCWKTAFSQVPRRRTLTIALLGIVAFVAVAAITWRSRAASIMSLVTQISFPAGDIGRDQPNAVLKLIAEFPSFVGGLVGGQPPLWAQRSSEFDGGTPGYSWPGFTYGLGFTDVQMPSLVGTVNLICIGAIMYISFRSYSWRKIAALALIAAGFLAEAIFLRAAYGFAAVGGFNLQPRYFVPLLFVLVGIATLVFPARTQVLTRGHVAILAILLSTSASVALRATLARYIHGQDHSWIQLADQPGWWWPRAPSPDAVWVLGSLAGLAWFAVTLTLARRASMGAPSSQLVG